jgi:hypothetical protein
MSILIDGYNLMHAAGLMKPRFGPGGLEKARRALLGILAASLGKDAERTTVVFDARPPSHSVGEPGQSLGSAHGIVVRFAAGEESADALIEKLIRTDSSPKQLMVVSSDARIRRAAQRRAARAVDSETFVQELLAGRRRTRRGQSVPPEKPAGQAAREDEFWLQEFDRLIDAEELRELAGPFGEETGCDR